MEDSSEAILIDIIFSSNTAWGRFTGPYDRLDGSSNIFATSSSAKFHLLNMQSPGLVWVADSHFVPKPVNATPVNDVDCPQGSYINIIKSQCEPCPAGKWSNKTFLSFPFSFFNCTACATGKFSHKLSLDKDECIKCDAGRYNDETGCKLHSMQLASSRTNSGLTSASVVQPDTMMKLAWLKFRCKSCDAGRHNDETGMESCKPCNPGRYSIEIGLLFADHVESAQQVNTMKIGHRKTVLSVQKEILQ